MPVPTYDVLLLPVLRLSAEKLWMMRDLVCRVAEDLGLTQPEREKMVPSGGMTVITSRVQWAKTYLKQAGLVDQPKRAHVTISARGRELLNQNPSTINVTFLQQFAEFRAFQKKTKSVDTATAGAAMTIVPSSQSNSAVGEATDTPEEQITTASLALGESLRDALLARVRESNPTFFEKLILDLLLAMGYGGFHADAGEHLGGTGDGGVDGVIREDHLGLDRVYLQAKRYQSTNTVGSAAVQAFMGALVGKGAQKGVLITTSTFTKAATDATRRSGHLRLVLIDGDELTRLMVRFCVGIRIARTVEIKRVDLDYFEEAEAE